MKEKEKSKGRGKTAIAVIALVLSVISLGGAVYFGLSEWRTAKQASAIAKENAAINQKIAALEQAAALEKNREKLVIQMEPHNLAAYMADSAYLYKTQFSGIRYESNSEASAIVKLRVPVTVAIFNNSEQTVTITGAALYPWETIFEETIKQETLASQQEEGFFGEIAVGQRDRFSIPPGESYSIEIDARLRGVYGHPALESETHRFFMNYFNGPDSTVPNSDDDVAVEGKGFMNGQVNYLFCEALAFYSSQRHTRFTLTYAVETARGNTFSATCTVPF